MNITDQTLERVTERYGWCASWAVWAEEGDKPKSNIGDVSIFDFEAHPEVRKLIHSNIIAVGLNVSGDLSSKKFCNFHSEHPSNNDYKLRHAFRGTPAWGCYMTDILKNFPEPKSSEVEKYIRANPASLDQHFKSFREEISILDAQEAIFLGLGGLASKLLKQALPDNARIINVRHYSDWRKSKELYREEFAETLAADGLA